MNAAIRRFRLTPAKFRPFAYRNLGTTSPAMASHQNLDINSKHMMNSGYEIPILGYGVYQTQASEAESVTAHAIKSGYRHVDSATAYRNEKPTVAGMLADKSIPRSQLFFTSKVHPQQISYAGAKSSVDDSLRVTGLDYIDLYLLHSPHGGKSGRLGAWSALVEAVEAGKVRSIGVSNYGVHHLEELELWQKETEASEGKGKGGVLSVNQVELHPWLARPDIVKWCEARGVILEAYSPIVRGQKFDDPLLKALVKKHGRTPAQVLLRWSLQKGFVPLPKSVTPKRIEENADIFGFELDDDDMKSLETGEYSPCAWDPTTLRT